MNTSPSSRSTTEQADPAAARDRFTQQRLHSRELFGAGKEIEIEHEGRIYRLRITQQNKLILTA